ncbi:heat stress transcription factor A-6a-like [Lycium barbarum]|uniref:heat stress transcription factor A-6a-like n=1 Tax=Lycium barbarum TaxID=112863 RepID=UPI00293E96AA|nr:heat stress transcription factor A-6a-like [Lycium barbarum]
MESDRGKDKMTNIDDIIEVLGEGNEGLKDVHIGISMLEDDDQCDNISNEALHGNVSNRRNSQRRPCPFVLKTYEMLADIQFNSLISWSNNGTSFIINDCHKFAAQVLPCFFRHNNICSFVCQLNSYGFRKVSWGRFEFRHELFQRGKKQWLKNIKRMTPKSQMNEQPTEQAIDETATFTMEKEIKEIREEQVAMREEIIMLQRRLEILEKKMEDNTQVGNNISSKKAKMLLFNSLFARTRELGSTEVAQEHSDEIEDGVENKGRGDRGEKRKMQIEEELGGKNEGRKKIASAADFKSDSYLGKMLMDEMNMNNLAQEQPDNFLESEELAGSPSFWTDYVEKMDHKAIFSGVRPGVSPSYDVSP